jgi:hypothetical protein
LTEIGGGIPMCCFLIPPSRPISHSLLVMNRKKDVGFRLVSKHPERIQAIITQNGNPYEEGLQSSLDPMRKYWESPSKENKENIRKLLAPNFTKYQYVNGTRIAYMISPDSWNLESICIGSSRQ